MATSVRTLTTTLRPPACATCGGPTSSRAPQVESIAHCPRCGEDVCWLDGERLLSHSRCASCQVLVGPNHASTRLRDGLCLSCYRQRARGRALVPDEVEGVSPASRA